jgi:predicted acetyltransferase
MLIKATANHKNEIYRLWKMLFSLSDQGAIDFFFGHYYDQGQTYLLMEEQTIVAGVCVFHHPIALLDKVVLASYFVGAFSVDENNHQEVIKDLLDQVTKIEGNQTLLSIARPHYNKVLESLGFSPLVNHHIVWLNASMMNPVSTMNVTYQIDDDQLVDVYSRFMKYFDGYKVRKKEDFIALKKEVQAQHGKLVGYVENNELLGYMVYLLHDNQIEIIEIIYFDVDTLMRLLYFAANMNYHIKVHISTQENWKKIFPKATIDNEMFVMGKINDMELFNDCFSSTLHLSSEIVNLLTKPLYFSEYQ